MSSTLGEQTIPEAKLGHSSTPSEPRCAEYYEIAQPEGRAIANDSFCLPFVSLQPKLSFQINQCTFWNKNSVFPIFNIWRPGYFGISLPELGSDPVKFKRKNDFIVTGREDDMEACKTSNTDAIPFSTEGLVAGINVHPPPGYVFLPNGERWNWTEIDREYYQFKPEDDSRNQNVPWRALIWQFGSSLEASNGVPADLPFALNRDTRICRVREFGSVSNPLMAGGPVAVMNRDGFVFLNGVGPKMAELQTEDNRALILMSGLAIVQYEGWLAER
ncbi:hypothetical protein N7476_000583 [Penicillium atrosanguineum]|uniref:Uncharacterized protein n=1 Tax=Penicillium atrosanguineum TaxID=1132637 RepID=A0A9W9UE27_9EURO|nr:hypothetical protein N7476_000583 [Penicillium atrosanguineum]